MTFNFRGKDYSIVLIDYYKGQPSTVITTRLITTATPPYKRLEYWDFNPNGNWHGDLMYSIGMSGGSEDDLINAQSIPVKPKNHQYWAEAHIKVPGYPYERLPTPITLVRGKLKSKNPFDVADEVSSICYCSKCGGMLGDSICDTHWYQDDNGDFRWKGNHKFVDQ